MTSTPTNYKRVINSLMGNIEEGFEDIFADKANSIQRNVTVAQSRFFKKLIMKTIGRKSAPSLGEYTPVWQPLSQKYKKKKQGLGQSPGFYLKTGQLKSTLDSLDAKTVLGTPAVLFSPSGFIGRAGVKSKKELWRGHSSKRSVIRDSKGRFAKSSDIPRFVEAHISVDPYPKILENAVNSVIDESKYFDEETAQKLKNPKGRRLRPIFTNFLNWFLETEIKKAVERTS